MPEYKIILVGDSAVGKTAMIHQFIFGSFSHHKQTTGVKNYNKIVTMNGNIPRFPKQIKLDVWDTAGQEEYS